MHRLLTIHPAQPASAAWNVGKTLAGTLLLWSLFLIAVPLLLVQVEKILGLADSSGDFWPIAGAVVFGLGSLLHLAANLVLAIHGQGTPWYGDCPRKLVVAGPYRYVRNPIAVAMLWQGLGVGLFLGSPLTLLYVAMVGLAENYIVRPWEEADLLRRFADAFARYRQRVRCWRPRWGGYDPVREETEPPLATERTLPPGRYVVLYDGLCKFCTAGVKRLVSLARRGALEPINFQEAGALDRFPGFSHEACLRQMYLVTPAGTVYGGFEAAVQALATRRPVGWLAYAYYLPGLRLLLDLLYIAVAAHRYRFWGNSVADCDTGTCALHARRS